jgi:serine/threonine-protein kinase
MKVAGMASTKSDKLAAILTAAQTLPTEAQDAYLTEKCGGDTELLAKGRAALKIENGMPATIALDVVSAPLSERTTIDFTSPDVLVGQTLDGRFLIEKNLKDSGGDAGGIGVVYLARDTKLLGKEVVVKILNETALQHPDIIRKFEHEKEALARLDHPGIVRILDSGRLSDGNPFMVMDCIKGHSLRRAIQLAGRLPIDTVANIIESVTDALTAAHTEKIYHRDIKPENIMLTPLEEGLYRVRIIDFGIAKVEDSKIAPETEIARTIGSIHYMAPEQLIGRLDLTAAADIYSVGIVAYEMLTGEPPFKPRAFADMYRLQSEGVKTPPTALRPDMPREAERVLLTALEFDPEKRPQNARAFGRYLAHELRRDDKETDRFYASIKTEFGTSPTLVIPSPTSGELSTLTQPKMPDEPPASRSFGKWIAAGVGGVFLVSILGLFAVNALRNTEMPPAAPVAEPARAGAPALGPERTIEYFLMVQKMKNGKKFEEPYKTTGQFGVEKGYRVTMNFIPTAAGYFYIYSFGSNADGQEEFAILFPTNILNGGQAKVAADQRIEAVGDAEGQRGKEQLWIIWTANPDPDLEAAKASAFGNKGDLDAAGAARLRSFLNKSRPVATEVVASTEKDQAALRTRGDELVYKLEIEHR